MRGNGLFRLVDRWVGVPLHALLRIAVAVTGWPVVPARDSRTVLVIKLSALGDTILLLPILRALKASGRRVVMVATGINRAAVEASGAVDELLLLETRRISHPAYLWGFLRRVRALAPGVALDFDQWLRLSPLIALASGAPVRIGFRTRGQGRHGLLTVRVPHGVPGHELDRFLAIATAAGIEVPSTDRTPVWPRAEAAAADASTTLSALGATGRFAVLHPGCGTHGWQREWPADRYAALAVRLRADGLMVVLSAGPGEEPTAAAVNAVLAPAAPVLAGLSVPVLAEVIRSATLFVSGNTGIMHLAAAVGVPVVALHGPTDQRRWGPLGSRGASLAATLGCSPCLALGHEYGCPARPCMESLSVDAAWAAATGVLGEPVHA